MQITEIVETFVTENLNIFIEVNDINNTKRNIKEFSSICHKLNQELVLEFNEILTEEESKEVSSNFIMTFLNSLKSSGSLFLRNLKDVFFNSALSKKLSFITMGISLSNLLIALKTKEYAISNFAMSPFGLSPTKMVSNIVNGQTVNTVANPLTLGIFSISLFATVMIVAALVKMVNTSTVVAVKSYSDYVSSLIGELTRFNPGLKNLNPVANKLYKGIVEKECTKIKDRKQLVKCGTKKYLDLNSKVILPELFRGCLKSLISKNINVDFVNSASDIFYYRATDRAFVFANRVYDKFFSLFDNIIPEDKDFKSQCLKIINTKCMAIYKQEIKNVPK